MEEKFDFSLRDEIVGLLRAGHTRPEIVKILNEAYPELNLDYNQVAYITKGLGGPKMDITKTKKFVGDRPRREVVWELKYEKGMTIREIMAVTGVEYHLIAHDLNYERGKRGLVAADMQSDVWRKPPTKKEVEDALKK